MISTVSYKVYNVDPNEDTETVIARARSQLKRQSGGSLPFGSESWKEMSREAEPC